MSFDLNKKANKTRALLIHIHDKKEHLSQQSLEGELEELTGLAEAIYLEIADLHVIQLASIRSSTYLGKGNVDNFVDICEEHEVELVVVNVQLSPIQQRNLERAWNVKVIDRTGLILEIFGERAQTKEGVIQVELAALNYQRSRLVRSWTHLERQRGGAGFMGGPGERQIEIDRRLIDEKITHLKKQLEKVRQNRKLQRKSRDKIPFPTVALVGYTNAGKSTLFNALTDANVFAEDLPFATLDPTLRLLTLPKGREVILSDTVGFIKDLPTQLIEAFKATLEQVSYADVIVHIRDFVASDSEDQKQNVISILEDLGISYKSDPRIIEVLNKVDVLIEEGRPYPDLKGNVVSLSALTGWNLDVLLERIEEQVNKAFARVHVSIPFKDGKALAWLHRHGSVVAQNENNKTQAMDITVDLAPEKSEKFKSLFDYKILA